MRRLGWAVALLIVAGAPSAAADRYTTARDGMIHVIKTHARVAGGAVSPTISEAVLAAMTAVPRHAFVPAKQRPFAYADRPLPIGHGQTISQPYIVALMTDLLQVTPGDRVLEIGTGSGYQAAVLAELGVEVYTIEIISALGRTARAALAAAGYDKVQSQIGDGYFGWPDQAPFDGIVVTAAASHVPPPLVAQLRPGARMVIPVGPAFAVQQLLLITKNQDDTVQVKQLLPVAFVPLTGER